MIHSQNGLSRKLKAKKLGVAARAGMWFQRLQHFFADLGLWI
jgi:hypothetical protein